MATIEKRNGSFRVQIRKKGQEIYKTFSNEEDAKLFVFYKERLIDNMENFDVPLKDRITLEHMFELKSKTIPNADRRTHNHFTRTLKILTDYFGDRFVHTITYDEWLEFAKYKFSQPVFRGGVEGGKREMAPKTLRNIFAYISSAMSHLISLGVPIENTALKVINAYIIPLCKEDKHKNKDI